MNKLLDMAQRKGGLITTAEVVKSGIPRARLAELVEKGMLERLQRGIYCTQDAWPDEYAVMQMRFPQGIYSDYTALYLHGYSDRPALTLDMTFPRSYRATSARKVGIKVRTCDPKNFELGLAQTKTSFGNCVKTYDLERSLCDILRGVKTPLLDLAIPAFQRYARSKDRNLTKLNKYARALGVEKKINDIMVVLL